MDIYDLKNISCASQTPKGVIYGHSKKYFMNIYGSLMNIFDEKNKDIYVEKNKRHL